MCCLHLLTCSFATFISLSSSGTISAVLHPSVLLLLSTSEYRWSPTYSICSPAIFLPSWSRSSIAASCSKFPFWNTFPFSKNFAAPFWPRAAISYTPSVLVRLPVDLSTRNRSLLASRRNAGLQLPTMMRSKSVVQSPLGVSEASTR